MGWTNFFFKPSPLPTRGSAHEAWSTVEELIREKLFGDYTRRVYAVDGEKSNQTK